MATERPSKRLWLGTALIGLGLLGLLLVYFWGVAPGEPEGSPAALSAPQPQQAPPPDRLRNEPAAETVVPVAGVGDNGPVTEAPGTQPDSQLSDAELERLNGVFLNTVYPLFQYDFQLSHDGRAALTAFVATMPEGLTQADLDRVAGMIERQLASPGADDVAFIITHLYRLEQEEARLMREGGPVTTMAGQLEAQEQLMYLREQWFGAELSAQLFSGNDEAEASADPGLAEHQADGERSEEADAIQAELASIERDWELRYQAFLVEKQLIDQAGLDQSEKDRQIEALLQQHYAPEEREAARAFGPPKP